MLESSNYYKRKLSQTQLQHNPCGHSCTLHYHIIRRMSMGALHWIPRRDIRSCSAHANKHNRCIWEFLFDVIRRHCTPFFSGRANFPSFLQVSPTKFVRVTGTGNLYACASDLEQVRTGPGDPALFGPSSEVHPISKETLNHL